MAKASAWVQQVSQLDVERRSEMVPTLLLPRRRAREMASHRAYQADLIGHNIGVTFEPAETFLTQTGPNAASTTVTQGEASG